MHKIQEKIVALLRDQGSSPLKYREIGRKIGEKYPQTVKHHIESLKSDGLIQSLNGFITLTKTKKLGSNFVHLPFYGIANCGPATCFADDRIQGFIKISANVLPRKNLEDLYLIRASGNSMNKAKVGPRKQCIEDGDFVIIDAKEQQPKNDDYVLSIIDDCANIKRFVKNYNQITLAADSSDEYHPIVLDESDNFHILGTVFDVIKNSK